MVSSLTEVYRYKEMLRSLVLAELRTRYKGSALGFLWTFLNPLLMLLVYTTVFAVVIRIQIPHYAAFMFIGLLAWNMFASALQGATASVVGKASLINKIYFPREILPLSVVGGSVINYILSLIILIPFLLMSGYRPTLVWLYFPLIIAIEAVMATGLSLLLASLNVFMRDLEHILGVLLMLWFYLTPILYPQKMVPKHFLAFMKLNPMSSVILSLQDTMYYGVPPHWKLLSYGALVSILLLWFGWGVFHRLSRRFAEEV